MNNYDYCVLFGLIKSIEKLGLTEQAKIFQKELDCFQSGLANRPISLFRMELYYSRQIRLMNNENQANIQ